jgi:hypothetical protein
MSSAQMSNVNLGDEEQILLAAISQGYGGK